MIHRLTQIDLIKNKGIQGSGLGLAITRELALAMKGRIDVLNVYNEGSTFSVRIPQMVCDKRPMVIMKDSHTQRGGLGHDDDHINIAPMPDRLKAPYVFLEPGPGHQRPGASKKLPHVIYTKKSPKQKQQQKLAVLPGAASIAVVEPGLIVD